MKVSPRGRGVRFEPFSQPHKNVEEPKRRMKACGRPLELLNVNSVNGDRHLCSFVQRPVQDCALKGLWSCGNLETGRKPETGIDLDWGWVE